MSLRTLGILLVEDDAIEAEFFLRCLHLHGSTLEVTVATSGDEALAILRSAQGRPLLVEPYIILLDLMLPGMSGFELLQELCRDPRLKTITVFVLSHSTSESDRLRAYDYGIAGFLHKGVFIDNCTPLIHFLEVYRDVVEVATLPPEERGAQTGSQRTDGQQDQYHHPRQ